MPEHARPPGGVLVEQHIFENLLDEVVEQVEGLALIPLGRGLDEAPGDQLEAGEEVRVRLLLLEQHEAFEQAVPAAQLPDKRLVDGAVLRRDRLDQELQALLSLPRGRRCSRSRRSGKRTAAGR